MSSGCPWHWRIALTELGLESGSFPIYGLPVPTVAPYNDSTREAFRSQGEQALHGFAILDILWEKLSAEQAFYVRRFIDDARNGTGWLYMTVDLNDDSTPGTQWADVRGRPHRDHKQADAGPLIGRMKMGRGHHDNYRLLLNNVDILANPSNYTEE
jgi:hypothetical protein